MELTQCRNKNSKRTPSLNSILKTYKIYEKDPASELIASRQKARPWPEKHCPIVALFDVFYVLHPAVSRQMPMPGVVTTHHAENVSLKLKKAEKGKTSLRLGKYLRCSKPTTSNSTRSTKIAITARCIRA